MWVTGAIGGLIGVIVCILLYMLFLLPGRQEALEQERRATETKETRPVTPTQVALLPTKAPATETRARPRLRAPRKKRPVRVQRRPPQLHHRRHSTMAQLQPGPKWNWPVETVRSSR